MKTTATLITGASNGIGLELAKLEAQQGNNVVLVARSEQKLLALKESLESTYKINATVIIEDLSDINSAQRIFNKTQNLNLDVNRLINNAGFGGHGKFFERELHDDLSMIQVNITTLTQLTHFYLEPMLKANKGAILNVSSTASFMPGPLQAVYYATKAYVTSFSQAIAEELAKTNITVSVLCPGAVATGFVDAGNLQGNTLWDNAKSAESVAKIAKKGMDKGELVIFNEGILKFSLNWIIPLLPRKLVLKMSRKAMEIS